MSTNKNNIEEGIKLPPEIWTEVAKHASQSGLNALVYVNHLLHGIAIRETSNREKDYTVVYEKTSLSSYFDLNQSNKQDPFLGFIPVIIEDACFFFSMRSNYGHEKNSLIRK